MTRSFARVSFAPRIFAARVRAEPRLPRRLGRADERGTQPEPTAQALAWGTAERLVANWRSIAE